MSVHKNNGMCPGCLSIFNRYEDFYLPLEDWFFALQKEHPEFHISCAGRGRADQEAMKMRKASRASYGESAHNYNAAIDLFLNVKGDIFNERTFKEQMAPKLLPWLEWYGKPDAVFRELPHVELKDWRGLVRHGALKLVE